MRRRGAPDALALGVALLALGVAGAPRGAGAVGEDPAAEVTEALRSFGPPGMVWGRLAVEEESPVGTWTPLDGIEVSLYPAVPTLIAELERIRQSARASAAQYESAVARVQAVLTVHQGRVDRQTASSSTGTNELVAEPPLLASSRIVKPAVPRASDYPRPREIPGRPGGPPVPDEEEPTVVRQRWRDKTDPGGVFSFDKVPSGDWLVVAVRVSSYTAERLRADPGPRQSKRAQNFLPRAGLPPKEAELWVTRVRVVPGERVGLNLTDRSRWLVGPLR